MIKKFKLFESSNRDKYLNKFNSLFHDKDVEDGYDESSDVESDEVEIDDIKPNKASLKDLKIGDDVWCGGDSGFTTNETEKIKNITTKYDENTGEPFNVIWLSGNRKFDSRNGSPINPPWAYYIRSI